MEDQLRETWERARQEYLASLPKEDIRQIETVGSMTDFLSSLDVLKSKYQGHTLPSLLAKADPLISQIQSFSTIIGTFISSHPEIAALIWGSVAFVLEVKYFQTYQMSLLFMQCRALTLFSSWHLDTMQHSSMSLIHWRRSTGLYLASASTYASSHRQ